MSEHPTSFSGLFPKKQEAAPVQEPAWYHAECNDPDYSRFTQEKDEAFAIVSDKGGYVTELYAKAQQAPVQEPVAWTVSGKITDWSKDFSAYQTKHYTRPVYTQPAAQRQWVGLTDEDWQEIADKTDWIIWSEVRQAIEAKLKEKNGWYRQHVTDGSPCWCEPEISYTNPETGASVIVHKEPQ